MLEPGRGLRALPEAQSAGVGPQVQDVTVEAIDLIRQADGVAVLAHPGLNRTDDVIPGLVEAGFDSIECFHTKHSTATSEHYLELADRFGLLVTGRSIPIGLSKGKPLIGTVEVLAGRVEKLRASGGDQSRRLPAGKAMSLPGKRRSKEPRPIALAFHASRITHHNHGTVREIRGRLAEDARRAGARNRTHRHPLTPYWDTRAALKLEA